MCPGKQFALLEIKMAIAYIVRYFSFEVPPQVPLNYMSTAGFAERKVNLILKPVR